MSIAPEIDNLFSDQYLIDVHVDAMKTRCPIPILRTKQALAKMQSEQLMALYATDPSTNSDLTAMLSHTPHQLLAVEQAEYQSKTIERFIVQKQD